MVLKELGNCILTSVVASVILVVIVCFAVKKKKLNAFYSDSD